MQPLGRKPSRFPAKKDSHLHDDHRKVKNWWEGEFGDNENKAASKREAEREIAEALHISTETQEK